MRRLQGKQNVSITEHERDRVLYEGPNDRRILLRLYLYAKGMIQTREFAPDSKLTSTMMIRGYPAYDGQRVEARLRHFALYLIGHLMVKVKLQERSGDVTKDWGFVWMYFCTIYQRVGQHRWKDSLGQIKMNATGICFQLPITSRKLYP